VVELEPHFSFRKLTDRFQGRGTHSAEDKGQILTHRSLSQDFRSPGPNETLQAYRCNPKRGIKPLPKEFRLKIYPRKRIQIPGPELNLLQVRPVPVKVNLPITTSFQVVKSKSRNAFPGPVPKVLNYRKTGVKSNLSYIPHKPKIAKTTINRIGPTNTFNLPF
jgi:hypothetical protein